MLIVEDLRNLASRYLHNPDSRVDKLRMRRSRSGVVKVLILLEIDGTAIHVRVLNFSPPPSLTFPRMHTQSFLLRR